MVVERDSGEGWSHHSRKRVRPGLRVLEVGAGEGDPDRPRGCDADSRQQRGPSSCRGSGPGEPGASSYRGLRSKEARGHRAAWPRRSREVPKFPAPETEVWYPSLREAVVWGEAQLPLTSWALGAEVREARVLKFQNAPAALPPCGWADNAYPQMLETVPQKAPWPRCALIYAPARADGAGRTQPGGKRTLQPVVKGWSAN